MEVDAAVIGTVEVFEIWRDSDKDFYYQWATVRR